MNTDEKLTNIIEEFKVLTWTITSMIYQTNNTKFSPDQKDTSSTPDPTTMVPTNSTNPTLDGGTLYQNWWHLDSQTWNQLTKILWATYQYITQRRYCYVSQELLQPHQDVSKCGDYTPIRPPSWLPVHQKALRVCIILHPRLLSPFLLLECPDIKFPWKLTISGND